jgi:pimeloyl-ACP methyl ester carboxylesterase
LHLKKPILNYRRIACTGAQPAGTLLVLHGLFGSGRNWQTLGRQFARHYDVVLPDLRNHGDSFWDDRMDYPSMAADVLDLLNHLQIRSALLLGHSMGGKTAMQCVRIAPDRWLKLVVADIAPVAYQHDYDEMLEPILKLNLARYQSRREVDQALASSISDQALRMFVLQSLELTPDGARWKLNWPVLKQQMACITGFVPLDDWRIATPTLFIRGGLSPYLSDESLALIDTHFSDYTAQTVQGAGHWLHADKPAEFALKVLAFLQSTGSG